MFSSISIKQAVVVVVVEGVPVVVVVLVVVVVVVTVVLLVVVYCVALEVTEATSSTPTFIKVKVYKGTNMY